jgi:hypothetical protein
MNAQIVIIGGAMLARMVAMGFVHAKEPQSAEAFLAGKYEIELSGTKVPAQASLKAFAG